MIIANEIFKITNKTIKDIYLKINAKKFYLFNKIMKYKFLFLIELYSYGLAIVTNGLSKDKNLNEPEWKIFEFNYNFEEIY